MSKSDQQSKIILFIKEVAKYFMDFLETDFHKRRLPKRSIQLHSKDNLLVGLNLNKYPSFNRLSWDLVISTFDKNKFNALQKGIYRADIPQNLVDIVKIQVKKLSEEQLADVLNEVATKVQEAIALFPKDFEQAINYAIDKASVVLKAHLIIPFITKLEQPLETLALGDENINYLMEEELTTVIMQLMEKTISETLKHAAAGEEIDAKNNLMTAIQINEVKSTIKSFFENFQVFDLYNEVYEMSRNKAILDKQEFYFYFSDISYNKVKYPIFYIPFSVEKSGESLVFEFDAQLYINKKALEYIAQQYNEERGKFGSIKGISERIIYLAQHLNNLTNVLQPIMDELTDFFELDARIKVNKATPQVAKGLFARITNSCYFALFDKSDEALVNDYEMILQLLTEDNNVLVEAFNKLIDDFIHKNPQSFRLEIEDDWDSKDVPDKLIFKSPIPLNSEQLQIVAALRKDGCKYVTVEGPPGTGKSHTITAIAFNAIMDKQNVLILSDKKEALDVVEDKITEAMNKVRVDKNFQNPILRLGKTGSTYSQILSNAAMNNINLHHRAVKKEYEEIENGIEKSTNTLRDELENEIARCGDIDLHEVYELVALEREQEKRDQPVDLAEAMKYADSAHVFDEFRKIFLNLKKVLNGSETLETLKLLRINLLDLKDLHAFLEVSKLAKDVSESIEFLGERYGSRITIITKFDSFVGADLSLLSGYIQKYEKLAGIFASVFKRGAIRKLDDDFKRSFLSAGFEEPRKCVKEIKEIHEIFHYSSTVQTKQIKSSLPSGFDFCHIVHSSVKNSFILNSIKALARVAEDLSYVEKHLSNYKQTFKKIGFNQSSLETYFENKFTQMSDADFEHLLRYIDLKHKITKQFSNLPAVNYADQQKSIQDLVTVQMTYIMDGRVIDFFEGHRADAVALREIIKRKEKFPQNQFEKLKEAFPCILAGIRDYAEYIPLEPEIFDLLIIDEASQVSIAQTFPALLRAKKVLILGDKKQFSNVKASQARTDTNIEYLNRLRDVFRKNISDAPVELVRLDKFNIKTSILDFFEYISNYSTQLMKYFRGYKEIISYSNKYFYQNTLQVMKIRGKAIDEVIKFSFIQHDGKKEPIQNTNVLEINFIIKEMRALKASNSNYSIGIITPHTNQQKLLMDKISSLPDKDYFFEEMRLKIMTFDTCQGEERDVIFYSMVANEAEDKLWGVFIKDFNSIDIEEDGKIKAQRLNVGFSRARECMHFVVSKPLDKFSGSIGETLRHYYQIFQDAKLEKPSTMVDPNSPMETQVQHWFYQTDFWNNNKEKIEFFPQFELGKYLRQLDHRYNHPAYKVDFLLIYSGENGEQHKIIIEYDGFYEHFKNIDMVNELNYWRYYSDEDIYREKVLESYGYRFLRINRFNVGKVPIQTLDRRLAKLVKLRKDNHEMVNNIHETIEGLTNGEMKECPKCKEIKKLDDFKDSSLISGIGRICKSCKGTKNHKKNTKNATSKSATESVVCPKCKSRMVLRSGRLGKFYGCSRFPYCKGTRPYP